MSRKRRKEQKRKQQVAATAPHFSEIEEAFFREGEAYETAQVELEEAEPDQPSVLSRLFARLSFEV